jgi:hypothetical protein
MRRPVMGVGAVGSHEDQPVACAVLGDVVGHPAQGPAQSSFGAASSILPPG